MYHLNFARYRFFCRAETLIEFPKYSGSAWRGALGHALRRTVCITRLESCAQCLLKFRCAYSSLFETPVPADSPVLRKYPAAPHPMIIHPEATNARGLNEGDRFSVELTLLGQSYQHLPYLVYAWRKMGEKGIGNRQGRFELERIDQWTPAGWRGISGADNLQPAPAGPLPSPPKEVPGDVISIDLTTPARIKYRGNLMGQGDFHFRGWLGALMRRLSLLSCFYGEGQLSLDFRGLLEQAGPVKPVQADLHWNEWRRYSNRQRTWMNMGGIMGRLTFESGDLAPFWPWIWAGQWLHVGKGTVMGLGGYRLSGGPVALPGG